MLQMGVHFRGLMGFSIPPLNSGSGFAFVPSARSKVVGNSSAFLRVLRLTWMVPGVLDSMEAAPVKALQHMRCPRETGLLFIQWEAAFRKFFRIASMHTAYVGLLVHQS